jgi:ribosomal protein L11 methyltransferase
MKRWPALDVAGDDDDLLAADLVDFKVTALEDREGGVRAYFTDAAERDRAAGALQCTRQVSPVDVDDEDWARRSQDNLQPITAGRITVTPPWRTDAPPDTATIVIAPSMGFGTGHHATTRLCLELLQQIDVRDKRVLDVGTGSGVLALAARMLGAREARGIDHDPDAIQSARENLALNPSIDHVRFDLGDVRECTCAPADIVTANLTGALLTASAPLLRDLVAAGGTLIISGLQTGEREQVFAAFAPLLPGLVRSEDGWIGAAFNRADVPEV